MQNGFPAKRNAGKAIADCTWIPAYSKTARIFGSGACGRYRELIFRKFTLSTEPEFAEFTDNV